MKFLLTHLFALAVAAGVACGVSLFTESYLYGYVVFSVLFYVVLILRRREQSYQLACDGRTILHSIMLSLAITSLLGAVHAYAITAWTEPAGNAIWMFTPEVAAIYTMLVIVTHGLLFLSPTVLFLRMLGKLQRISSPEPIDTDSETQ